LPCAILVWLDRFQNNSSGFDLDGAVAEKRAYNAEREDHKPENRRKEGGKAF
jgi:hypothetical protein